MFASLVTITHLFVVDVCSPCCCQLRPLSYLTCAFLHYNTSTPLPMSQIMIWSPALTWQFSSSISPRISWRENLQGTYMVVSKVIGVPPNHSFLYGIFPHKASFLGYPHLWKSPFAELKPMGNPVLFSIRAIECLRKRCRPGMPSPKVPWTMATPWAKWACRWATTGYTPWDAN